MSGECPKSCMAIGVAVMDIPITVKAVAEENKARMVFLFLMISFKGRPFCFEYELVKQEHAEVLIVTLPQKLICLAE